MGRQVFTAGEILTAANMNDLSDQTVMVFDDATARATAIPTPVEGMVTYLKDTDRLEQFDGTNFVVAAPPQTGVLQVVSTAKTDTFTSSSTSFVSVTGLSASITPSSTASKIFILAQVSCGSTIAQDGGYALRLDGGNSSNYVGDAASNRTRAIMLKQFQGSGGNQYNFGGALEVESLNFLDSPASISAVTYTVQIRSNLASNVHVNRSGNDTDSGIVARGASSITLMEVAG